MGNSVNDRVMERHNIGATSRVTVSMAVLRGRESHRVTSRVTVSTGMLQGNITTVWQAV